MKATRDDQRKGLIKNWASKSGLRPKINAFCIECIYDPYSEGTWRKQVTECTALTCPLFSVRPLVIHGKEA